MIQTKNFKFALLALIVSVLVLILKLKAYYLAQSVAVLSDALETIVNVITAIILMWTVRFVAAPADEDHPYGHGKAENFSAAFEGGLIFFAALVVLYQAVVGFINEAPLGDLNAGNFYLILATVINLLVGVVLVVYGRSRTSEALKASGKHLLADVFTTIAIVVGLYLTKATGVNRIDSIMAFFVGLWLLKEAYDIVRVNSGALLDEADDFAIEELALLIDKHKVDKIIDIHNLRIIRSGSFHHIDAHVVVPQFMDIQSAHIMTHDFEKKVVNEYGKSGEFAFHMDPCKKAFCKRCGVVNCEVRQFNQETNLKMDKNHLIKNVQYTN